MKKIKMGMVEYLGVIGAILWTCDILLREFHLSRNPIYLTIIGSLPNWGAAWIFTAVFKVVYSACSKKPYTIYIHAMICASIFFLGLLSEWFHATFLSSPFDMTDMIVTLVAQLVIFFLPVLTKKLS